MARQGIFINNYSGELMYRSFKPAILPPTPNILIDDEMLMLLTKANHLVGDLNGKSSMIPNIDLFISMYVRKEALLSSQIEGTQSSLDDIFDPNIDENIDLDKKDVVNYVKAINFANELKSRLPMSLRFIKEVHKVLIGDTRGKSKNPGSFRSSQNWIGPSGSSIQTATFVPPNVSDMEEALSQLEKFIHQEELMPPLIKVALIHYQFETIHPFLDGNGRVGRLLIELLMHEYGVLDYHTMYMSYFLKQNRIEYYDRLNDVRFKGHYEEWVKFFLRGIKSSAHHAIKSIDALVALDNKDRALINSLEGSNKTLHLMYEYIKENPIFSITSAAKTLHKAYNTIAKSIHELIALNIIKKRKAQSRNQTFIYEQLLNILRNED